MGAGKKIQAPQPHRYAPVRDPHPGADVCRVGAVTVELRVHVVSVVLLPAHLSLNLGFNKLKKRMFS